jgi:hypothetical protein
MPRDYLTRAALRCQDQANKAARPEERNLFLLLAQEFRKLAAEEAKRRAQHIPKRPPALSVRHRRAARKRA